MAFDWDMLFAALGGGLGGAARGYETGSRIKGDRAREEREQQADNDARSYRASQSINDAMAGFDKQQLATERRGRLAKGNRAILGTTAEGKAVLDALGASGDEVLGDYEPNALDDIINRIRPPAPKREPIDRYSPEGVQAQMQIDEQRARLRSRYPTARRGGGSSTEDPTRRALLDVLSATNTQIDDARTDVNRLSKPLAEAEEGMYDVAPSDTMGLGDARKRLGSLTGQRDKATAALMQSNPALARLFASDSTSTAPPGPPSGGTGNIDLGSQRQGPPRGVAQPLSEKEKFKARSDEKFRAFLKQNGYSDRDWQ